MATRDEPYAKFGLTAEAAQLFETDLGTMLLAFEGGLHEWHLVADPERASEFYERLNAAWKRTLYEFARKKLLHPAWGWTHSERNFLLAFEIATMEGLAIDVDVLFAASFAHDIGAIGEFQREGIDHAVRSVEIAEPLLRGAGFPVEKLPAVREAILGHMHDKQPGGRSEAIVLHDADTLDFLGAVGVARRLAVTGTAGNYAGGVARIREFADNLPRRLLTQTAKAMAAARVAEMRIFLDRLTAETADGRLP